MTTLQVGLPMSHHPPPPPPPPPANPRPFAAVPSPIPRPVPVQEPVPLPFHVPPPAPPSPYTTPFRSFQAPEIPMTPDEEKDTLQSTTKKSSYRVISKSSTPAPTKKSKGEKKETKPRPKQKKKKEHKLKKGKATSISGLNNELGEDTGLDEYKYNYAVRNETDIENGNGSSNIK